MQIFAQEWLVTALLNINITIKKCNWKLNPNMAYEKILGKELSKVTTYSTKKL